MKKIHIALIMLQGAFVFGQTLPPPVTVPAGLNLTAGQSIYPGNCIIVGNGGYTSGAAAQAIVEGVNYVQAMPGYKAGGFTGTGYGSLRINNNLPRVVSYHPNGFTGIPQYSRFEIGVNLPSTIQGQIDQYIQSGLVGANKINPYDPAAIRVECVFSYIPSSGPSVPYTRHGFYRANDVSIAGSGNANDNWVVSTGTPEYPFRVRFAPPTVGNWQGVVNVYINGTLSSTSDIFTFTVISSVNPGHLSISTNPKTQKLKYPSGRIFYGVGRNVAYAEFERSGDTTIQNTVPLGVTCGTCWYIPYYENKAIAAAHRQQRAVIHDLALNGCNFVRVRLDRTSVPIEETPICNLYTNSCGVATSYRGTPSVNDLTNFSRSEKYMWEMDNTLATCESDSVRILLTILQEGDLSPINPNADNGSGWERNPYSQIQGITGRDDFFTNTTAIATFQKRLYYIEARWGYSTSIGAWEMINETERINAPVYNATGSNNWNTTTRASVSNWLVNMRNYLKSASIYPVHPVTTGGADMPWAGLPINQAVNLDFCTDHDYRTSLYNPNATPNAVPYLPSVYQNTEDRVNDGEYLYSNYWNVTTSYPSINQKPHLVGEGINTGPSAFAGAISKLTVHDEIWGSLFANSMSTALLFGWHQDSNDNYATTNPGGISTFDAFYYPFRTFVNRINFNTLLIPDRNEKAPSWRAGQYNSYFETDTDPQHTMWMRTQGKDTIYGWTRNTTANWMVDAYPVFAAAPAPAGPAFITNINNVNYFGTPSPPSTAITASQNKSVVQGLLPNTYYDIAVYSTWWKTNVQVTGFTAVLSDANGLLKFGMAMPYTVPANIAPPSLPPAPDYAFIITKTVGGGGVPTGKLLQPGTLENTAENTVEEGVYPVPTANRIYLNLNKDQWTGPRAYVSDELGKVSEVTINKDNTIDLPGFANGFYVLRLVDATHEKAFKIVIQH